MLKTSIRISLAQVPVVKGDVTENLAQHIKMIEQSSLCKADVVVFPELSLTGYELEFAQELALSETSHVFEVLSQAAVDHNIIVLAGCPLKVTLTLGRDAKPTIGAVICFPDGTREFYAKQYLHEGEGKHCSSGVVDYVFTVNGYRIALAICADFASPEHAQKARELGADIYIASALISERGFEADAKMLSSIAATHGFPVLLSNHISTTGGWAACGNNTVWNASGERVFSSESKEPCVVLCTMADHKIDAIKI